MKYQNYTYEYNAERLAWLIIDRNGKVIAEVMNEEAADLIVGALNCGGL